MNTPVSPNNQQVSAQVLRPPKVKVSILLKSPKYSILRRANAGIPNFSSLGQIACRNGRRLKICSPTLVNHSNYGQY